MHGQLLPSGRFAAAPDCYSCRRGRRLRLCYDRSFWAGAKQLLKATDYFSQPEAAAGVRNGCTAIQSLIAINKICLPRTIFLPPRVFFLRRSRLTGTSLPSAAARARARSQGTNVVGNLHPRTLSPLSSSCPKAADLSTFLRHPRALSFFRHPRAQRPQT